MIREAHLAADALARAGRATEAAEFQERRRQAVESERATELLVRELAAAHPNITARFVVNVGSHDGKRWGDPCFELYQAGWNGIAIDAGAFPDIDVNLPQPGIDKLMETFVTPDNIEALLIGARCPREFDLLKVDIDSFDGPVLRAALRSFRPSVVHVEVNPEIPPPLSFAIDYDPRYVHFGLRWVLRLFGEFRHVAVPAARL